MTAAQVARQFTYFRTLQKNLRLYETLYGDVCGLSMLRRHVIEEMRKLAKLMRYGPTLTVLLMLVTPAFAQHDHDRHHTHYRGWYNKVDTNCCNDQDCGELDEADESIAGGKLMVRVEGMWCPVLAHHYLKRGNVPNASVSHVCVQKQVVPGGKSACERLLCYQPRPGI